jgi:acyl-CoA synthetase (AMP-forming)/AMP-acid ligase II
MTRSVSSPVSDRPMIDGPVAPDTFPKLLLGHARLRPDRPANREKDYGIWQSWSWAEVAAEVEALAARNARQKGETLLLGAIAQQRRRALPVGDPVRADRGAPAASNSSVTT